MPTKTEEIEAVFLQERHRWGETIIAKCKLPRKQNEQNGKGDEGDSFSSLFDLKTTANEDELTPNLSYRFYGHWQRHPKYGSQFHAKTFIRCQPHGRAGVVRYLSQAPHIGYVTAGKLWAKFGGDAVRITRESPDIAAAAVGGTFKRDKAAEAAAFLESEKAVEDCSIELVDLLGGRGFPRATGKLVAGKWGNRAAGMIRRNPYLLMQFPRCGFATSDKMYLDLGGNPARLKRQALCAWYVMSRDNNGHTWHDKDSVVRGLREKVSGADVRPADAVRLAKRARIVETKRDEDGQLWIADAAKARAESVVAERVLAALDESPHWPARDTETFDELTVHQTGILGDVFKGTFCVLAGCPGTGKTFTAARIIAELIGLWGSDDIAVAAPTGKAAVRITEALAEHNINLQATTIHRLLKVAAAGDGGGWSFEFNANNLLPHRFVVIDESSMVSTDLMASLLSAVAPGTHVLFVGDTNQLPPVSHGAPLRDMIAAGVPCGELREIKRNAGTIIKACKDMRDMGSFEADEKLDLTAGRNLKIVATTSSKATDVIVELLKKLGRMPGVDPIWDCQVIVAVNEKSELSRRKLNKRLQGELNPGGVSAGENPFHIADKMICLKNGLMPVTDDDNSDNDFDVNEDANDEDKVFVANGEIGRVVGVADRLTIARFPAPSRLVKIPRGTGDSDNDSESSTGTGCNFDLAYAVTCHKMQGSEISVAIVVLDDYPSAKMVCDRAWLYTAISRAKKACLLIGQKGTATATCRRQKLDRRKTFLKELIRK